MAGGKLQRRTVARGSHGVHQSLRQFGLFVKELFCLDSLGARQCFKDVDGCMLLAPFSV